MRLLLSIILFVLLIFPANVHARSASLKGSVSSQMQQNRVANTHKLSRLRHVRDIKRFVKLGLLVPVRDTKAYYLGAFVGHLDPENTAWYRYARPWVKRFLDKELGALHHRTGERFKITSLVRTKAYQRKLVRNGANAISGRAWWKQSSHLTGATIDISYKDMSRQARRWVEKRLLTLERRGLIEATKEYRSYCYHIMVFPAYRKTP